MTLTVREIGPDDFDRWDAHVDATGDATFFHLTGWKRAIEKAFGHDCPYLIAEREDRIEGVLPLVHVKSPLFGSSLVSTGFTVGGGPLFSGPDVLKALDAEARRIAEQRKVEFIEYRTRNPVHDNWAVKPDLYAGFRKDIDEDHDANMKAIPRKQRAMVRKGIKAGLESVIDDDIDRLHDIYATSVRNLGTPVFAKSYFRILMDVFGDRADIVTITTDGRAVASVMNFYFRDEVLPYYGGGTTEARPLAANDFMYWEVMRRAVDRGFRIFDFGRSKRGTGAFSFKKNWGFEPEPFTYEYDLLKLDDVPEINPLNPKYKFFIAAWKRLPVPVAKTIGPMIARGLG